MKGFNPREAEMRAENLLAYEGVEMNKQNNGLYGYNGMSDSTLLGYQTEAGVMPLQVSVSNAAAGVRTVRLCGGIDGESTAGVITSGAFNDISGAAGLSGATTSPLTFSQLFKFFARNPGRIIGMDLTSDSELQRSQQMTVTYQSPFRNLSDKRIPLTRGTSQASNNLKIVNVDLRNDYLAIDDQTIINLPIVATSNAEITLWIKGIGNIAVAASAVAGA